MTRRSTILVPGGHDGTSQRDRPLPALDPGYAAIDERTTADLLAFIQAFAEQLRYVSADELADELIEAGTWSDFASHQQLSIADMVAYIAEPERFTGEHARWLGRPHFALLLTFLELLGRARAQLNDLTGRHLDYYYREILQMQPEPARPDRAAIVLRLASRVAQVRLPAGTALQAGRDSSGVPRIYRTERDLLIHRAQVAALRSVFVDRRITGISDVRENRDLTAGQAFEDTLRLALGTPSPGDPILPWRGAIIDLAFIQGLRGPLDITSPTRNLYLQHHELRTLMRLVRQRDAGLEWPEINRLLGVTNPADPRDFEANLASRVGTLDFAQDGLSLVNDIDDLYEYRSDPAVRAYIEQRLAAIGWDNFVALMPIKLRIDGEWAEINRLLERAGQRKRSPEPWSFPARGFDPTAFLTNLTTTLGGTLPAWPWQTRSIYEYEARIRELEAHLSMSVDRLDRLVEFAETLAGDKAEDYDWIEVDRILVDAHREHVYASRRAALGRVRGAADSVAGFDAVVTYVLSRPNPPPQQPIPWTEARATLAEKRYLDAGQLGLLDRFRGQLANPGAPRPPGALDWPDVYRLLELAQRYVESMPEPVAYKIEWRNLYAYEDARARRDDAAASPRWKTFGDVPAADPDQPPEPVLGWALRSPLLSLSQGTRTLTLTLGFTEESFDLASFQRGLGLAANQTGGKPLRDALTSTWLVEVSTAKGWIELAVEEQARLATGASGNDYWSLSGVSRTTDEKRPALQFKLLADVTRDPIVPLPGTDQPALRVRMRQRWDAKAKEWTTLLGPFEPLRLAAVHLHVAVADMTDLELQQDDRALDPRKPFEPFGSRPASGARLYLGHPELVRNRLATLRLDIDWMGLPASLASHYTRYPNITGAGSFKARIALIDRNLELLLADTALFEDNADKTTKTTRGETVNVPAALQTSSPGFAYTRRVDVPAGGDLRAASRHLRLELSNDFGHSVHPALAARWAAELSVAVAGNKITDSNPVTNYQVNAPYTPVIKRLRVSYTTALELDLTRAAGPATLDGPEPDRLLHVHPFGDTPIAADDPSLLPRYDQAGELYIGLRDLDPTPGAPRHLALLLQLAEGTSDPELEPAPVSWSCLDGDRWRDLDVLYDSTRGLINSGIVELALPGVAPSARLPGDLYWLRVAIARNPTSVCDAVDIRAQAVTVRFDDRGNAADHYAQPLPVGTIQRLVEPDARIAAIEQPFTSFGGKPPERPEQFRTRVSERLRHKQRALSPWDYERLVLQRFGQIYKAKCLPAGRHPGHVDVIVIPDIRQALPSDAFAPKASADLLADIHAYLSERAPAAASIRVRNAHYVPVLVRLGVRFKPGQDEGFAKQRLNEDLLRFLSPWAYDEGVEAMIGGKIYASSIIDFVDRRDYVDYVAELKLFRGSGRDDFVLIPPKVDYHVATDRPDQVLVAARQHIIDVIPELGYQQASFTGIDYMKIELDFIVGE